MNINALYLKALLRVAAEQDIRYYLNGILIETTPEGGKFYVATDGHRLGVFHEGWGKEEPETVRIIIPRQVVAQAKLLKPEMYRNLSATLKPLDAKKWTYDTLDDVSLNFAPLDGKFPEWRKVLPAKISGDAGDYNWRYLYDFNLLAQDAGLNSLHGVLFYQNGDDPGVITAGSADFVGILMPQRMGDVKHKAGPALPAWFKQKEAETA